VDCLKAGSLFSVHYKETCLNSDVFGKLLYLMYSFCVIISVMTAAWMR